MKVCAISWNPLNRCRRGARLRCAEEAAAGDWPAPVRDAVPVNVTVPAVGSGGRARDRDPRRLPDRQGQGRRARADAGRRPGPPRGRTRRAGPGRPDPDRRQRRLVGRRGGRGDRARWTGPPAAWSTSSSRAPSVEDLAAVRRRVSRPDRRRRVDPAGRGPLPRARPGGRRHRRAQGAAARWRPGLPADRGGDRAAGGGVVARSRRRSGSRPGWRSPRRCPTCRTHAGWPPSSCSPTTSPRRRCSRSTGCSPVRPPVVDEAALDRLAAPPDALAHWEARLRAVRAVQQDGRS